MLPGFTALLFAGVAAAVLQPTPDGGIDSFTKLLLHGEDTGATITDASYSVHTFAVAGGITNTTTPKYGAKSLSVDGVGGSYGNSTNVVADWAFGTGDFTIDAWANITTYSTTFGTVLSAYTDANNQWKFGFDSAGKAAFDIIVSGSTTLSLRGLAAVGTGAWHHIAVVRYGNVFTLYVDGLSVATQTVSLTSVNTTGGLLFGTSSGGATANTYKGLADEVRVSKGVARWTANFIPLDKAYSIGNPRALLHFDGTDASTVIAESGSAAAHIWSVGGSGQLDNGIVPKFGSAALLCGAAAGWVSTPTHADFTMGTQDFTWDIWFNRAGGDGTRRTLFGIFDSGGSNGGIILELDTGNHLKALVFSAPTTSTNVVGTTAITTAGWHHGAIVRTGNTLKLFLDGVQEGGDVAFSVAVNTSANALAVGRPGAFTSNTWNGSLDEFRCVIGQAMWTSNFTPPTAPYPSGSTPAPTVFDIGTAQSTAAVPTISLTVPAGGIPAGSTILIASAGGDNFSLGGGGSCSDTAGNTYTQVASHNIGTSGFGFGVLFLAKNSLALAAGNTITVTRQNSIAYVISGLYAIGRHATAPWDSATAASADSASGSSSTPSVTSGTPAVTEEIIVGLVCWQHTGATYGQDSSFAVPFNVSATGSATTQNVALGGGWKANPSASPVTFSPSLSVSSRWVAFVGGLKPP